MCPFLATPLAELEVVNLDILLGVAFAAIADDAVIGSRGDDGELVLGHGLSVAHSELHYQRRPTLSPKLTFLVWIDRETKEH